MATSSSSNRPVVLSLRELERYPTVYDRYEMTLPFYNKAFKPWDNPLECSCHEPGYLWWKRECEDCDASISFAKVKAMAIRQTEKRWNWFSEARKLDDRLGRRLGTLGFLPLEIREKIWHAAIEGCMPPSPARRWFRSRRDEPEHNQVLDQGPLNMIQSFSGSVESLSEAYPNYMFKAHAKTLFHRSWYRNGVIQLRHASPEAMIELENVFVFRNPFRFWCPVVFRRFLDTLSARQITLLRSITIELSGCHDCCRYTRKPWGGGFKSCGEAWIASIERLPATIQSVTFEFGWKQVYLASPDRKYQIFGNKVLAQLEIVSKKTRRQVPNGTISIGDLHDRNREDCEILQDILAELDEYSEDYKKWWRESREKTMSQGEKT